MKKLIGRSVLIMVSCLIMLLLGSSVALAEDSILKIGYLNSGKLSVSESGSDFEKDMGASFAFSIERALEINEGFELGYGGSCQLMEDPDDSINNILCLPIYLLLNYYPFSIEGLPYLTGHLGYNYIKYEDGRSTDLHGLYYALGAGICIPKYPSIRAEVVYMVNSGSGTAEDRDWVWDPDGDWDPDLTHKLKATYGQISLSLGLGF